MKPLKSARYLLVATLFMVFPFRLETDQSGKLIVVAPYAHAKSGSGKDGNGGSGNSGSGGGDDGESDDGESDSDNGESDDGESDGGGGNDDSEGGESDDSGDDGERDDSGDDGESTEADDDSERGDGRDNDSDSRHPIKVQKLANGARIIFSDGSQEEIRDGQFSRTDRNGRIVERRRARSSDLVRMRALFGSQETQSDTAQSAVKSPAVKATYRGRNVEILYSNGWREEISSGRYNLIDQYGRAAASRRATQADRIRLNRFRK